LHLPGQFRLLTLHYGLYQFAIAAAVGFAGAYLLQQGFGLPQALACFAGMLAIRCVFRFAGLGIVRRIGFRHAVALGALIGAAQFWPFFYAQTPTGLVLWLLIMAFAESLYWPVYHSAVAVTGADGERGKELGVRTMIGAAVGIIGPLTGGLLMQRLGPSVNFAFGAALMVASAIPLLMMRDFDAGPVPEARHSMELIDRKAIIAFASDGWMASGLQLAWPMVLFVVLGSQYETFGLANAAAGLAGAAGAWFCGRAIDAGDRDRYLALVSIALGAGFALRAAAGWSPVAATIANATGAAVMGVYIPVLMSHIYDSAKTSGAAYRFHFAAEAGWDFGAATGCLAAALVVMLTGAPSLAVVPGALGILVLYAFVRRQPTIAQRALQAALPRGE
jgi:hypothetical protein